MHNMPTALAEKAQEPFSVADQVTMWKNVAINRYNNSNSYSELHEFYDGYASACEDVLKVLKTEQAAIVEAVKKGHKVRNTVVLGVLVGGGVICYRRYKNGVLFPWQKDVEPS